MSIPGPVPARAVRMERQGEKEKESCTNPNTILYDMEAGKFHKPTRVSESTPIPPGHTTTIWPNPIFYNVVPCGLVLPYLRTCC